MGWMQTYGGGRFYPEDVKRSTFQIGDIAHALGHLCRFGGHTRRFYSVAQHSVLVSEIVQARGGTLQEQLLALLHDSTEAYMVDVPTPVKAILKGYKEKEAEVFAEILKQLKLPVLDLPPIVKEADAIALATEARQLINGDVEEWEACRRWKSHPVNLDIQLPHLARELFLNRWHGLQEQLRKL